MAQRILSIFGVKDTRLLPEASMQAVMNPNEEERRTIYCAFLELHRDSKTQRIDLSRDLMAQIYEQELAQRKENKQDFTPSSVSIYWPLDLQVLAVASTSQRPEMEVCLLPIGTRC